MKVSIQFKPELFFAYKNDKVAAIKELRNSTGFGLKEAKDVCDLLWDNNNSKPVEVEVSADFSAYGKTHPVFIIQKVLTGGQKTSEETLDKTQKSLQVTLCSALDKLARVGQFHAAEDVLQMLKTVERWK